MRPKIIEIQKNDTRSYFEADDGKLYTFDWNALMAVFRRDLEEDRIDGDMIWRVGGVILPRKEYQIDYCQKLLDTGSAEELKEGLDDSENKR